MWLIRAALRRPISVIIIVVALALVFHSCSAAHADRHFPGPGSSRHLCGAALRGHESRSRWKGFIAYYYEYHFLYINGIESVEAKSIQGTALLRLTFHPGTDMSQALAQTISYVNRARAFMPPGTVSPFVIRYDAGTLPVGYLVFSSRIAHAGRNPGPCFEPRAACFCDAAGSFLAAAVWRQSAHHRDQR